jgi:hypothetical protein
MEIIGETLRTRHTRAIDEQVTRSYVVGLRFPGQTAQERRSQELFAAAIVQGYQRELYQKLTPPQVERASQIVKDQPQLTGTTGSAILRRELGDCSNLGEAAYLPLLQTLKGMRDRQDKLQVFLDVLIANPHEFLTWYLYGRAPYGEQQVQRTLHLSHKYVVDLVLGARRALDALLPPEQQLAAPYPPLTASQLLHGLQRFQTEVQASIAEQLQQQHLTTPTACQHAFLTRLERLNAHAAAVIPMILQWLASWNHPTSQRPKSRWRHLNDLSRQIVNYLSEQGYKITAELSYCSVLRGILVTALLPQYHEGTFAAQLQVKGMISVEKLISKPFSHSKPFHQQKLPLQLLMGSHYVVGRQGNAAELTAIARTTGRLTLQFWPYRHRQQAITGELQLHPTLQMFLQRGAEVALLTLNVTDAPAVKLAVTVTLTGTMAMFFRDTALQQYAATSSASKTLSAPLGIGVDVNRLGDDMLTFSEPVTLPSDILVLIKRYNKLETPIKELSLALTRKKAQFRAHPSRQAHIAWLKVKGELERVYARRHRVLKTLHQKSCLWVAAVLLQTATRVLCIEDLALTAKDTRGALAKIILSLPDEQSLFQRACLLVEWMTGESQTLVLVDPRNTSQGEHLTCSVTPPGYLCRDRDHWDLAPCSGCGQLVNTHHNASLHIRRRGITYYTSHSASSPH